jgi:hypothetical protein
MFECALIFLPRAEAAIHLPVYLGRTTPEHFLSNR